MQQLVRSALFSALALHGSACSARELLTLRSGFSMEAESHQVKDGTVTIFTAAGTIEMPVAEVIAFEPITDRVPISSPVLKAKPADAETALALAANSQGLAPEFVRSVAKVESGLRQQAVSPKGAVGLMQLMPGTAAELGVLAQDAEANARGGAQYLRQLLVQYKGDAALALAAYNAGPAAVARYNGIPPYAETRQYVVRVLAELAREQRARSSKP